MAIYIGDHKEMILILKPPGRMHWELVCFGNNRHYRKDGSCKHTAALVASVKSDWHRKRVRLEPFGGRKRHAIEADARRDE